jgi:hypothetical protein
MLPLPSSSATYSFLTFDGLLAVGMNLCFDEDTELYFERTKFGFLYELFLEFEPFLLELET